MFPRDRRIDLIELSFFEGIVFIDATTAWTIGLGIVFLPS